MKKKYFWTLYFFSDFLSSTISWLVFNYYRKTYIEKYPFEINEKLVISTLLISAFWIVVYAAFGNYKNVYKKYRIKEITQTLSQSFIGIIFIFFTFLLDDKINSYQDYYSLITVLIALHISLTFIPRILLTSRTVNSIHQKKIGFNTIIIGGEKKAKDIFNEIKNLKKGSGQFIIGYVSNAKSKDLIADTGLEKLGDYHQITKIIEDLEIEEVIIATESDDYKKTNNIINDLANLKVEIKVIADMYSIITGSVKMNSIFGALLISVNPEIMPSWQKTVKRILDLLISTVAIVLLIPVFIVLSILIKIGSKGNIIFKQQRIGLGNKPFKIFKFRSMFLESEKNGPQLSSQNDPRITPLGRFIRKTRLDETPQFFNVIKGDMSLVGPRPERQFFIDEIIKKAPHYKHISNVKPGITSWGQVKYGYAENVDEMIDRLKFDLLYVENMSLSLDIKILFYTIIIMLKGSGK